MSEPTLYDSKMPVKRGEKQDSEESPTSSRTALVTGGATRLGRAISRSLADNGYSIGLHYHGSEHEALAVRDWIRSEGVNCGLFQADLRNASEAEQLLPAVQKSLGPVDLLVNSASGFGGGDLRTISSEVWSAELDLNLRAPFLLSQSFLQTLGKGHSGQIINILDARLRRPEGSHLAYRVAKAGLLHLTRCLAKDLAPHIRVNGIAPGALMAPAGESPEDFSERLGAVVPLGLVGGPSSLTRAINYLLSEPFLTGQILYLDGGQYL